MPGVPVPRVGARKRCLKRSAVSQSGDSPCIECIHARTDLADAWRASMQHRPGGPGVSRGTEYRYRSIAKKIGIGSGALFAEGGVPRIAARLDFESGSESLTDV